MSAAEEAGELGETGEEAGDLGETGEGAARVAGETPARTEGEEEKGREEGPGTQAFADILDLDVFSYFDKGYKPKLRMYKGQPYILLRLGERTEKWVCPSSEERWAAINKLYNSWLAGKQEKEGATQRGASQRTGGLLRAELEKPKAITKSVTLETSTLMWYEWALTKGFRGDLGQFLNEVTKAYFTEKGLELVLAVKEVEG